MKNPFPLFIILLLAIVLAYGFYMAGFFGFLDSPAEGGANPGAPASSGSHSCKDGQAQYCRMGNCSGESVCIGGAWSGCRWNRICNPGSTATCLKSNCPYGLKVCNECGTGYGPCSGLNSSG